MNAFIESLSTPNLIALAKNPMALTAVGIMVVLSILFRWNLILLLLFAVGAILAIVRLTNMNATAEPVGNDLAIFGGGTVAVALVIIYFLFIKGD
ncbi:MAG TPA: hypothetical protein VIU29_03840 [Candidatus Deferrimicrobiaceae bacterium]